MKRILFVNDEMTMGGVARILNTLLKQLPKNDYQVDLLVLHGHGELLKEVPSGVNVIYGSTYFDTVDIPLSQCRGKQLFHKLRLLWDMKSGHIFSRIRHERKQLLTQHYDIEFAAKEGFCTIFVAAGDSAKKINWIQVDYRQYNYSQHHMALMRQAGKMIDQHIACSKEVLASYESLFGIKGVVIPNLMDENKIRHLAAIKKEITLSNNKIRLITVARFHPQKAVDRLIRIFAKLQDDFALVIIGDGKLRDDLHCLAREKGVEDKIQWLGLQENPYPDIAAADLFVMSSLYEGYPTITIESLLCATPVLTTEVAGVKAQITRPEMGWIVANNEEALYEKLVSLRNQKALLQNMKCSLRDYHYENEKIMAELETLFDNDDTITEKE